MKTSCMGVGWIGMIFMVRDQYLLLNVRDMDYCI